MIRVSKNRTVKSFVLSVIVFAIFGVLVGNAGCAGSATAAKSESPAGVLPSAPSGAPVASITITPGSASATTGETVQFAVTVQGTASNKAVTWKAALGQISASGFYTAPASAGDDTVTAIAEANAAKTASVQVAVSAPA